MQRTGLRYNQIPLLEPPSNARPEPIVCNQRIRIHDFLVLEFRNLELARFLAKFLKALRKFGEKRFHPSLRISSESNFRVIKVELFVFYYCHQRVFFLAMGTSTNLDRTF